MNVQQILNHYSDAALNQVSSDKVEEAVNLRLPRSVIVREVSDALSSLAYVAKALAPMRPPAYAFLKILLESPEYMHPVEGFHEKVLRMKKEMALKAESGKELSSDKNYQLYLNILKIAWEDDVLDRSETIILQALREELGIWTSEHLLLEHHPKVGNQSDLAGSLIAVRNHLLVTGIVLTYENNYILGEEVARQIRTVWGIDLDNHSYERLLNKLNKTQLYNILEKKGLQTSGSKEEQIQRVIEALIPPAEGIDVLHIDELRELCRQNKIRITGIKAEVIVNIIDHFDQGRDLLSGKEDKEDDGLPEVPEERELNKDVFCNLFRQLSNDQLYDILSSSHLKTSGIKEVKIERLMESPWSERSLLNRMRRLELSDFCRKLGIPISGIKSELLDRIIDRAVSLFGPIMSRALTEDLNNETMTGSDGSNENILDVGTLDDSGKSIPPIQGLEDIRRTYDQLESDEITILALIKEIKSLTEQDIDRASARHGVDWFLTKAHMAEMIASLKRTGSQPVRIRSIRNVNIYEWVGDKRCLKADIEKTAARDVIDALRQGVVPERDLDLLVVGQENARDHLVDLLHEVHEGKSAFKFIRGPYGAGKTFLCSWLRQYALDNEFVVSTINIGPDQPLSDLPVFFSGVINGLRTPEKRDSCAFTDVLEAWLLAIHRKTAQIEGLKAFDRNCKEQLVPLVENRITSELAGISNIDPCFSPALCAFYHAVTIGDSATAAGAAAWLSGSRSMPTRLLNQIGVRGYLEANQVFPRMRALLEVIGGSRFKGLLLLVDELELIRKFPHTRQREKALETLRLLIDETGINGFPGCLLVFTGTDTFFEDDRAGLKSYEALDNRVALPDGPNGMVSVRQPVLFLEGLNSERLFSVVGKIRDIHGIAYDWKVEDYISDAFLRKLVREWTSFGDGTVTRKPRPVLREFIHILDICEENPNIDLDEFCTIPPDDKNTVSEIVSILEG